MNSTDINLQAVDNRSNYKGNGHTTTDSHSNTNDSNGNSDGRQIDENTSIIEVLFKGNRRCFFVADAVPEVQPDDKVVVNSDNGIDLGLVTYVGASAKARLRGCQKLRNIKYDVLRIATDEDLERYFINTSEEPTVVRKARELVAQFNLDMKVTEAEWQLDKQRLTIFFTAPQRIDFRELVKELARAFKTRIELRQISTREETKRIGGGIGPCGLNLCCTSFLNDFNHITLEHARIQQLSNNVSKLSGYCGRLKCCLLYEYETYTEAFKDYPQLHSRIQTEDGLAKLIKVDIFKHISTIQYVDSGKYRTLEYDEISKYMKDKKILPPAREDMERLFRESGIITRKDMHGEEYIVEQI